MLRTLRFSQLRFRRNVPPCGGMCAALMFRRFNVPAARRRPTFRRWITPGYDPGRDSLFLFFLFLIFYPDQAATTERRDTSPLRRKERRDTPPLRRQECCFRLKCQAKF